MNNKPDLLKSHHLIEDIEESTRNLDMSVPFSVSGKTAIVTGAGSGMFLPFNYMDHQAVELHKTHNTAIL